MISHRTASQKYIRNLVGMGSAAMVLATPYLAFAATCGTVTDLEGAVTVPFCYMNTLIPILVGVEILLFIYGIVRYLMAANNDKDRQTGRKFALWGIVAIAVTVGVWGLIMFLRNTVGITDQTTSVKPLQFSEEPQDL
jgi:uncharacterized membrane protein YidH (DUF202 family)